MGTPAASRWRMGIDLGGTKTHAVVLDPAGQLHWEHRVPTPSSDYDATLRTLSALVAAADAACPGHSLSVGVGGPGSLTPEGLLKNSNSVAFNGRALVKDLQAALGREVRFANDANCLALSEATDGAGAGCNVVFAAILGTGCGAGIAVNGRVLTGPNGLAGEWGHNPLPWRSDADPARACYCGKEGCNETFLSGSGIAQDHWHVTGQRLSTQALAKAAQAGDAAAAASLERHAQRLARALASVINLVDPDVIVLGGGVSRIDSLYERVPTLWSRWVVSGGLADPVRTRLVPALHGDASGVRGAAWLWDTAAHG